MMSHEGCRGDSEPLEVAADMGALQYDGIALNRAGRQQRLLMALMLWLDW
jgi:hypothetical protein